jgi:hypothetical protein
MVAEIQTQQVANNSFFLDPREIDDNEFASFLFRDITSFSENHELPILPRSTRTFQEPGYWADSAGESQMIDRVCAWQGYCYSTRRNQSDDATVTTGAK